jgi:hypothetical protein
MAVQMARRLTPTLYRSPLEMAAILGTDLDPWQRDALASEAQQLLLNVTRQGGKSTVAALIGLHRALYVDRSLVLIVSPGERQSFLLFEKVMASYKALGRPVASRTENVFSLKLVNGSQVHALPGKDGTIRGFSDVALLLIDEAARVPDPIMAAVRPMLAVSGGRLIAMSTPWGKRGWWHSAWTEGGDDWQRYEVPATDCPRISPEFLAQERRTLPDLVFRSEFLCEFTETEDQYFRSESIGRAFDDGVPLLFPTDEAA